MLATSDQSPRFRTISLAALSVALIVILILFVGTITKLVGAGLLFFPTQLGIVQQVTLSERVPVSLATRPALITLPKPGTYLIYADVYQLLLNPPDETQKPGSTWLTMQAVGNNQHILLKRVERGLRPYDPISVPGRPLFSFTIETPGEYRLSYPLQNASLTIIPDYTTGREQIIGSVMSVELGIFLLIVSAFAFRRYQHNRKLQQQREAARQPRLARAEAFWQAEVQRQEKARHKERVE